jgi:hypothetical protein
MREGRQVYGGSCGDEAAARLEGRGGINNKHSTDVESRLMLVLLLLFLLFYLLLFLLLLLLLPLLLHLFLFLLLLLLLLLRTYA